MVLASFFTFILSFTLIKKYNNENYMYNRTVLTNRLFNITILLLLLYCSIGIILPNKTSLISIVIVLFVFLLIERSIKIVLVLFMVSLLAGFIFYDKVSNMIMATFFIEYSHMFNSESFEGSTAFNYIFNFPLIIEGYKENYFWDYFFGKYLVSNMQSAYPFAFFTELRLLSTPLYFGLFWTIIVSIIVFNILKYCLNLIKSDRNIIIRYYGLAFLGFFIIYFLDIHYPVFIRHGPFELFFIMTATLSSCYMFKYKEVTRIMNKK
jgi:hypothetical protein